MSCGIQGKPWSLDKGSGCEICADYIPHKVRKRVNTSSSSAFAGWEAGELAVGSGAYSGNGGYIQEHGIYSDSDLYSANCSCDRMSVCGICCPGVYVD